METNQKHTRNHAQAILPEYLPPTIFGIPTKDSLTVCMGVAIATIGINRIIKSMGNG